ncbi:MAG: response regulator [Betaproteobacteria bacterium]|nr:MAG: response regulator [Betaproteobacteria bacterium]
MSAPKAVCVLVVDDNEDMRSFMKIVLERAGYETELAADGQRALELQRRHPADVLVTDIFMPEADGLETIERFRSEFPRVRIVAMSGGGSVAKLDYLTTAREAGADAVLRKPFEAQALLTTLETLATR